jgi:PPOX class probable F420-dependent enzyme
MEGDVHDRAAAALLHPARRGLQAEKRPFEVDCQRAVPAGFVDLEQRLRLLDPGVVDEHLEPAEPLDDLRDQRIDGSFIGDVFFERGGLRACGVQVGEAADAVGGRARPVVRQDHTEVHDPRLTTARVARLATTDPDGRPHLVPIVFALEDDTLYSAVDHKPKRSPRLRRIENARARPEVTILVDHYEEDWGRLWWIRLRGRARVLDQGEEREHALILLREKYPQYRSEPPDGPVLAVDVTDAREWAS